MRSSVLRPKCIGVQAGDMEKVRTPLDFIGINNYFRMVVKATRLGALNLNPISKIFPADVKLGGDTGPHTDLGWEVYPRGLYEIVMRITKDYKRPSRDHGERMRLWGCARQKRCSQ